MYDYLPEYLIFGSEIIQDQARTFRTLAPFDRLTDHLKGVNGIVRVIGIRAEGQKGGKLDGSIRGSLPLAP